MSVTIELSPETEARLAWRAAERGLDVSTLVREIAEREVSEEPLPSYTVAELLRMPMSQRHRILERAAEHAAPLYEADLALPPYERELTAFTALDGIDPIYDEYPVETADDSEH